MSFISGLVQFIAGGTLTVLTTLISGLYGPAVGALVWVYPSLLYVSAIAMRVQGKRAQDIAALCYASAPTTVINAASAIILGWLIMSFPGNISIAIVLSIIISTIVGYGAYRLL